MVPGVRKYKIKVSASSENFLVLSPMASEKRGEWRERIQTEKEGHF